MNDERADRPRVLPDRLEAGVSGLARMREWDAVRLVELPELEHESFAEFSFRVGPDHSIELETDEAGPLPAGAAERLRKTFHRIRPPAVGKATRRSAVMWSVAARRLGQDAIELDVPATIRELSVAVPPDGDVIRLVDGEELLELPADVAGVLAELERLGKAQFDSFAVRAERLDERLFGVRVDAL